ncbi:MAG TPA: hypothetical protein VIR34_05095 [Gemmatimonadaceae bacterium]|jgi:hypothetical protein
MLPVSFLRAISITQRPFIVPTIFAHISLPVGQLLFLAAFRSGDPSGLQYPLIFVGLVPIGLAAAILAYVAVFGTRPSLALPLNIAASVAVAVLPGLPGAIAVAILFLRQLVELGLYVWLRRKLASDAT